MARFGVATLKHRKLVHMSFQKFMAQPLVLGLIVVSALLAGPAAILVAAVLIAGWAINNRLRPDQPNRTP